MRQPWNPMLLLLLLTTAVGQAQDDPIEADKPAPTPEQQIQKALADKGQLQCVDTPLEDAMRLLSQRMKVPVVLDRRALEEVGISAKVPVTINVKGISNRSILRLVTKPLDATFVVRDEVIQITTVETSEGNLQTRVLPVADIIVRNGVADFDPLIEAITSVIEPNSWEDVGGPGAISPFKTSLIVSQTSGVARQVDQLLTALRAAMKPGIKPISFPASARIRKALQPKVTLNFSDVSLTELAPRLSEMLGCAVLIDRTALEDAGIADQTVTIHLKNVTASAALRLMLRATAPSLTYDIQDEALVITTSDALRPTTAIYPVDDLCKSDDELNTLVESLQSTVRPDTWAEVGGHSDIYPLDYGRAVLLVAQTPSGHDDVTDFFAKLRKAMAIEHERDPALSEKLKPSTEFVLRSYLVQGMDAKEVGQLTKLIEQLMPDAWSAKGAVFEEVAGRLVVKQQTTVHRQLQQLADEMGIQLLDAKHAVGGGLGGGGGGGGGFGGGGAF